MTVCIFVIELIDKGNGMSVITRTFSIANISIQASADTVKKKVGSLGGVRMADVDILSNTMCVEFDDDITDEKNIIQAVAACGYQASTRSIPVIHEEAAAPRQILFTKNLLISAALSIGLLLLYFVPFGMWLALPAAGFICWHYRQLIIEGIREPLKIKAGSAFIRAAAAVICMLYGLMLAVQNDHEAVLFFFDACAVLIFTAFENRLISLGRTAASSPVRKIRSSLPETASVYQNHHEEVARVEELKEDQILVIRPGDIIPADGTVVRGFAQMDESALTGMDTPIGKSEGSAVYANSVCVKGSVEIRAEKTGSSTAMMRLADLAEKTASDDSFQSPFKVFGRYLLVYILIASLITSAGWLFSGRSLSFAISVMVSVMACASLKTLGLSSENEVMRAAGEAISNHVIYRSVEALELAGKTDYAVIEQNGAVTENEMAVTDFICAEGMSEGRLEYIAYALESKKDRPFARAITRYLRSRRMSAVDKQEFTQLSRLGRNALKSLSSYHAGTYDEIRQQGIATGEWDEKIKALRSEGKRVLIFARNTEIIGVIAAVRPLIPGAAEAVEALQNDGIELWLLSDGTADESRVLQEKLHLEHVVFHPAKDDIERLLASLNEEDSVTAYIGRDLSEVPLDDADIAVAIGTGADPDRAHTDIQLTRNRLSDFRYAVMRSKMLNEKITSRQLTVLIYHAAAVLLFGFLIPALTSVSVPVLACISACAALWFITGINQDFR